MSNYTDADVARMLGWRQSKINQSLWIPDENYPSIAVTPRFGLSTPPGPEADANSARYVLPWAIEHFDSVDIHYDSGVWSIELLGGELDWDIITEGDDFGPTLCRAALDARRAGK
jgi:hypothetical protein